MNWKNELTKSLSIKYPIIQAPMLGVTTPEMVAAISNGGGLGSLPVGGLPPEKTKALIRKTKTLTNAPFAVNLFCNQLPQKPDKAVFESMQDLLASICMKHQFHFERQSIDSLKLYSYIDQIDCILSEDIPVISFTFGKPDNESIEVFKQRGIILIGTATCLEEAEILDRVGIDIITAQGIEAGGHRGTFLEDEPLPMISLMILIPQLAGKINKPIVAAGGINDGSTIKAAFVSGAKGVQIGTAFIASNESAAISSYKEALQHAKNTDSILTKAFSGRWARGLRNKFITEVENAGTAIPEYPFQVSLTTPIRMAAQQQNNKDFTALWAGLHASKPEMKPATAIFNRLIEQTAAIM